MWCLRRIWELWARSATTAWTRREEGFAMLPDLRVGVAAVLAGLMLIVAAFGLAATVRLAQHAKIVPIEGPRALAYADPDGWKVSPYRVPAYSTDRTSSDLVAALPGA